ncbi:MAG: MarR family transcriptional regulator [Rubrobacteraceae bacterium]|uniref:MarR family winged helix-turn-helix transcriptional regulator n=1 Tax=Rubrobacter naiadicus TaxID=1392641 RepID=UPI0023611E14|nr:MarR family transcriptional regulator [Rubrobacter naiadicus]MBX6763283.1 MarR family transcriptional regulator [Rubrobacteraceae bacterium]MCL6438440.1 MarR family transcriptional regulator [Rubrobacteraceae bacterium]
METENGVQKERVLEAVEEVNPILAPLALASKRIMASIERDTGVAASRWFLLAVLGHEDGMSQGELCKPFHLDPSRISRLAKAMEEEGLVRRERDPEDNRVVRVYLTGKGRELLGSLPEQREKFERRVREVLDEGALEHLRDSLYALAEGFKE